MKYVLFLCLSLLTCLAHCKPLSYAQKVDIDSTVLAEKRSVQVSLPESYSNGSSSYPVIYVLHGQWDTLPAVATLSLLENLLPEFIVVGIEGRGPELKPAGSEERSPFYHFVLSELIPYVNKNYRIAPYSILSGHSNAGRFVFDMWLHDGKAFSEFYAFSPSLDDGYLSKLIMAENFDANGRSPLTLTMADEGEHMLSPFQEISKKLAALPKGNLNSKHFPEESHSTTRHASLRFALSKSFSAWNPSREVKKGGLESLQAHYNGLLEKYGFTEDIPMETLQRLAASYAISEEADKQAKLQPVLNYFVKQQGHSLEPMVEIAQFLLANNYQQGGERMRALLCQMDNKIEFCGAK
ncbi:alpha/beta hydrolase-fold protein [uncultured Pseudoteredinibacter sp.]|uniref:alpha/beta hydrolase n=1 Tax=uncultured Pseudoteredinibacter sp. TaxID=1641701 RepID=UPI00260419F8|nr:alpha/beta hydrolase-fold protein [uncultured Pseudoteredinibacter sp.]